MSRQRLTLASPRTLVIRGHPPAAYRTFAGFAAFGLLWGGWAALVPQTQEDVGASNGALGLALLCVGVGSVPAMILVGPVIDRRGPQVMPVMLLSLAAAAVAPALASSVWTLALTLVAVGAASGAVDVSINSAAADVEARTGERIMQLAHGLFSVGVLTGAIVTGVARELGAGRLVILSGIAVVLVAAATLNLGRPGRGSPAAEGRRVRLHRNVLWLGLACGAAFLVEGGIENWSALFLERELEATPLVSSLGPASYALAMVAGRFSGQWFTGRLADRLLLAAGALLSMTGLLIAVAAPAVPVAMIGFFLGGAGVSVAAPVAFSAAARSVSGAERGSAVATVTTIGYLGFLAGPPVIGAAAEVVGLRASFLALAAVTALLAVSATRLRLDGEDMGAPADPAGRPRGEAA